MAKLRIHRRQLLPAAGPRVTLRLVNCPADGRAVPIEACSRCGYGRGETVDGPLERPVMDCERAKVDDHEEAYPGRFRVVPSVAIATCDVLCVSGTTPITDVRRALSQSVIGCLPVVDGMGRPEGVISHVDLVDNPSALTAAEAMTANVVTIAEMTPITRAAALMAFEGIHHLPVLNDAGAVVAILSSLDILRHLGQEHGYLVPEQSARRRTKQESG